MSRRRLALVAILLVGLASATVIQSFSWNQTSHYDLTRAIYHGKTTIDQYQANTGDKAYYKGHWYSARAPGLALFSQPFYEALILVRAESWTDAHVAPPDHPGDEMIYLLGLWGERPAGTAAAAARVARGRALRAGLRRRDRGDPRPGHDGAAVLAAAVLAHVHHVPVLRRLLADAEGARRAAQTAAAGAGRPGDGLRVLLGVPHVLRGARARAVPALAARRAHARRRGAPWRRLRRRRHRRHRAAAALQPLRLPLLDAPRLLRHPAPAAGLLRDRRPQPEGARSRCCSTRAAC